MRKLFILAIFGAALTGTQAAADIILIDPYACDENSHLAIAFDILKGEVVQLECLSGIQEVNLKILDDGEVLRENSPSDWWCEVVDARGPQYDWCEHTQ